MIGVLLIVIGLACVAGGVTLLTRSAASPHPGAGAPAITRAGLAAESPDSHEKGLAFEKWVVKRFNQDYFKIKEWRGDKFAEGRYAETSTNPDLEIEFFLRDLRVPFAVECKWRVGFDNAERPQIVWADERQIKNYQDFSTNRKMPVFVVIGVGGTADDPRDVYVVNLKRLRYPTATADYLARFRRRKAASDWYYDYKQSQLK